MLKGTPRRDPPSAGRADRKAAASERPSAGPRRTGTGNDRGRAPSSGDPPGSRPTRSGDVNPARASDPRAARDLVDGRAVRCRPAPPLLAIDRAEIAVSVGPLIPDRNTVFFQVFDIGIAAMNQISSWMIDLRCNFFVVTNGNPAWRSKRICARTTRACRCRCGRTSRRLRSSTRCIRS